MRINPAAALAFSRRRVNQLTDSYFFALFFSSAMQDWRAVRNDSTPLRMTTSLNARADFLSSRQIQSCSMTVDFFSLHLLKDTLFFALKSQLRFPCQSETPSEVQQETQSRILAGKKMTIFYALPSALEASEN